jgi:hypothetical protein
MSQLGRISGPLLESNLNRLGVDLTFRNYGVDDDLLYLEVTNGKIGVNKTPITHKLEVNGTTRTTDLLAPTSADIASIVISTNTFSTDIVTAINIAPNQTNPIVLFDNLKAGNLDFKDNVIKNYTVNGGIAFDPSGTGITDIQSNTKVNGNLSVTGNMQIDGNLTEAENIIVGDSPLDVVVIAPDFTQSLIPGQHLTYDLGQQANDSSPRRWSQIHVHGNSNISNLTYNSFTIGQQLQIDTATASIYTLQSNDDVRLLPNTGITDIERFRFQGDTITNLDPTAFTLASTGIGYVRFVATNGVLIPAGTDAERPTSPEVGATRWNTSNPANNYLECYDGSVWIISTGLGGTVNQAEMNDLGNLWSLILG